MTRKKYIIIHIIFILLMVISLTLFGYGLSIKDKDSFMFSLLMIVCFISLASTIIFIIFNYKKLVSYEADKIKEKIEDLDYTTIDYLIDEKECFNKLLCSGYRIKSNEFLEKKVEIDTGDGGFFIYYSAKIIQIDGLIDISSCLEGYKKELCNINLCYIFINENIDENLNILKEYIKATIVDTKIHSYRYKNYFIPMIIANNKVYYINYGTFLNNYKDGVKEGIKIFKK